MDNLKEFKELILTYESLTIDDIKTHLYANIEPRISARKTTGFGAKDTCKLCIVVHGNCSHCVYIKLAHCLCSKDTAKATFDAICMATLTPDSLGTRKTLVKAYHERAKYMRRILEKNHINI